MSILLMNFSRRRRAPSAQWNSKASTMTTRNFCGRTRREMLWQTGSGFAGLALTAMMDGDGFLNNQAVAADGVTEFRNPLAPKEPHFAPKAKNVIFLYMYGGPSQVDTFDYKPSMYGMDGKTMEVKTFGRGGHRNQGRIVEPRWKFKQYGECGKWISDLFPHLGTCADDIAFVHSMTADSPIHGSAMLMMNSGRILSGHPCIGSWANYGLGSVNEDLPGFVVMLDPRGGPISGSKNWSSGYMPATYQATVMRSGKSPILDLTPPSELAGNSQRRLLDTLRQYNEDHYAPRSDNSNLAARIASYELAYKMQSQAPEAVDISQETAGDAGTIRSDGSEERKVRTPVPAGSTPCRTWRSLRTDLLRRCPQRRQLGRSFGHGSQPQSARGRNRQTNCRTDQGSQRAWPAQGYADCLGR